MAEAIPTNTPETLVPESLNLNADRAGGDRSIVRRGLGLAGDVAGQVLTGRGEEPGEDRGFKDVAKEVLTNVFTGTSGQERMAAQQKQQELELRRQQAAKDFVDFQEGLFRNEFAKIAVLPEAERDAAIARSALELGTQFEKILGREEASRLSETFTNRASNFPATLDGVPPELTAKLKQFAATDPKGLIAMVNSPEAMAQFVVQEGQGFRGQVFNKITARLSELEREFPEEVAKARKGGFTAGEFAALDNRLMVNSPNSLTSFDKMFLQNPLLETDFAQLGIESPKVDLKRRETRATKEVEAEFEKDQSPKFSDALSAQREFNKQSKTFIDVRDSFSRVAAAASPESRKTAAEVAAADISMIFAYMKMLDPGSVVREGEQATAEQARGVPDTVLNLYNKLVRGGKLSEEQVRAFALQAERIMQRQLEHQLRLENEFRGIAERNKFNPRDIVVDHIPPAFRNVAVETASPSGSPSSNAAPEGSNANVIEQINAELKAQLEAQGIDRDPTATEVADELERRAAGGR